MAVSNKKIVRNQNGTWNVGDKISQPTKVIDPGSDYEINVFDIEGGKRLAVSYSNSTQFVGTPFEFDKESN